LSRNTDPSRQGQAPHGIGAFVPQPAPPPARTLGIDSSTVVTMRHLLAILVSK